MLPAEHAQTAIEMQERAEQEFASGNRLIASEILWGAVAHTVMAVASERGWPIDSHGAFRASIRQLSRDYHDPSLITFFDSAEKLHENFYHNNIPDGAMPQRRRQSEALIPRLLARLGSDNGVPG